MKNSVHKELQDFAVDLVVENVITSENIEDAHNIAFNEDYYIVGYSEAEKWLESHDITPWEAIEYIIEQERFHFGEINIKPDDINSERAVNLLVFFSGLDVDFEEILEKYKLSK